MGSAQRKLIITRNATCFKPDLSEINFGRMKFLVTERPTDSTIKTFIEELEKHHVTLLVRVCEPTYGIAKLAEQGIDVLDWEFKDGSPPPPEVIEKWLQLVLSFFKKHPENHIAVHCVAGLGRAPVLVALALIEAGMKYEDAVELIRRQRRGALNQKQLTFLEKYKPAGQLRKLRYSADTKQACGIM